MEKSYPKAKVVIKREGNAVPEVITGIVTQVGTSHCYVVHDTDYNKGRHPINWVGEWFPLFSKSVKTYVDNTPVGLTGE